MEASIFYYKQEKIASYGTIILKRDNKQNKQNPRKELLGWGSKLSTGWKESWSRRMVWISDRVLILRCTSQFLFQYHAGIRSETGQGGWGGYSSPSSSTKLLSSPLFPDCSCGVCTCCTNPKESLIHMVLTCEMTLSSSSNFLTLFSVCVFF